MKKLYPAVWVQLGTCSGCVISVLNSLNPSIKDVILDDLLPGKHINLLFMPTIMSATGKIAMEVLYETKNKNEEKYLLIVEGSVSSGKFGEIGDETFESLLEQLTKNAYIILSLGTCASFGGIPKGNPNPTKAKSVKEFLDLKKLDIPVINVPGCPPHPDWVINTIAHILLFGIPQLDELLRPKLFYGKLIHEICERRPYFDKGKFAKKFSDEGCLYELGCKGPYTHADCPIRSWNSGVNWCIQNGSPCIGCCEPEFPDLGTIYTKTKWK